MIHEQHGREINVYASGYTFLVSGITERVQLLLTHHFAVLAVREHVHRDSAHDAER